MELLNSLKNAAFLFDPCIFPLFAYLNTLFKIHRECLIGFRMTLALPPDGITDNAGVSNLLPELLLGLLGHTGGAFVSGSDDTSELGIPKLSKAVDWITLPER